jgi:hypothetical protein
MLAERPGMMDAPKSDEVIFKLKTSPVVTIVLAWISRPYETSDMPVFLEDTASSY